MEAFKIEPHIEQSDFFSAIRGGFAWVAKKSQHVSINEKALQNLSDTLQPLAQDDVFDTTHHYIGDLAGTTAYVLVLDTLNFGSGYESYLRKEGWEFVDDSFYFTFSTRLKEYFEQNGIIEAQTLSHIQLEDTARILKLNINQAYSFDFARIATLALREFGQEVEKYYGGSYISFVQRAAGHAESLVGNLSHLTYFNDVHNYKGVPIPFYKRAQITAADLHLAYGRLGQGLFSDIDSLTMFPDNSVPHILRRKGVLEYTTKLAQKIDGGMLLASGSEEEIEIRACAGHVVELIAKAKNMTSMDVDHILWHANEAASKEDEMKPHQTICSFY